MHVWPSAHALRSHAAPPISQEEDRIITAEEAGLKKSMGDRTLTGRKLKEYLLRIVYAEVRARAAVHAVWRVWRGGVASLVAPALLCGGVTHGLLTVSCSRHCCRANTLRRCWATMRLSGT